MTAGLSVSRRAWTLVAALWLLGAARLLAMWAHDPLIAYANSYDETRYTSCFHLYPDRPADIPPQRNSPDAPYSGYRFIASGDPMCYWSSEWLFQGVTALIYRVDNVVTGAVVHSVRWIGALRMLVLLALSATFSIAWLRRGESGAAIANAALLPLLLADPGNTLYLNTFYAEWTALLAAYALIALILLWRDDRASRAGFLLLALAAGMLATSKIQHLLLPLALAVVVLVLDHLRRRRIGWRAVALLFGSLAGLSFQIIQMQRDDAMMQAIRQYNAADVVFTALLPFAEDRRALLAQLGIDPACAIYSGDNAWQLPDLPYRACRGLIDFNRARELGALLRNPRLSARLAGHGVLALDPWVAEDIGHIEGRDFAGIPPTMPSLGNALHASAALEGVLLALPFVVLLVLAVRQRWRSRLFEFAALTAALMVVTLGVTVLGDGLADTAKQGHLVVCAALGFALVLVVTCVLPRPRGATTRTRQARDSGQDCVCTPSISTSSSLRQMSPASNSRPPRPGAWARSAAVTRGASPDRRT